MLDDSARCAHRSPGRHVGSCPCPYFNSHPLPCADHRLIASSRAPYAQSPTHVHFHFHARAGQRDARTGRSRALRR